jgi:hypothetical protein
MNKTQKIALGIVTLGLIIGFFVWQSQSTNEQLATEKSEWKDRDEMTAMLERKKKELFAQILRYSGKGHCKETSDCKLIPYGPKLCEGGTRGNLIYSSLDVVDHSAFLSALQEYNSFMDEYNAKSIRILDCVGRAKKAKCQDSACTSDNG